MRWLASALNVVTVGEHFIFSNALCGKRNVFDRLTGKVISSIGHNDACCRFALSERCVLGSNMEMIELSAISFSVTATSFRIGPRGLNQTRAVRPD